MGVTPAHSSLMQLEFGFMKQGSMLCAAHMWERLVVEWTIARGEDKKPIFPWLQPIQKQLLLQQKIWKTYVRIIYEKECFQKSCRLLTPDSILYQLL